MKRQFLLVAGILMTGSILLVTSCSKDDDDTTAPVVTLIGNSSEEVILNTQSWTDPGATATDDEDGTVTVTSDYSSSNPNTNFADTYTITYSATDAAGNVGTATRTVRVYNEAENYAGSYNVVDTCGGTEIFSYTQVITVDENINNRIRFSKFADYANNTNIYAVKLGDGSLTIPNQDALSIGSGVDPCAVADHSFSSPTNSVWIINNQAFRLNYIDQKTNPVQCISSTSCVAYYMK